MAVFAALVNLLKASRSSRWGALITLVLIALGMRWECWIFRPQPAQATGFAIPAQIQAPAASPIPIPISPIHRYSADWTPLALPVDAVLRSQVVRRHHS